MLLLPARACGAAMVKKDVVFTYEERRVSITPRGKETPVIWRYETKEQADNFAKAHWEAWKGRA